MAPGVRTKSEADRKEQILTAARKVFREKGYEAANVSDIVGEAGVAQGTFYLYFPSKKDAVVELAWRPMEEMAQRVGAAANQAASFEERLRAVTRTAFQVAGQFPDLCRLIHHGADSALEEVKQSSMIQGMQQGMVKMFEEARDGGEMEPIDPEVATQLLFMMFPAAMQEAYRFDDGRDAKRIEEGFTQMVVSAFVRRC